MKKWKILSSKKAFDNKWFEVQQHKVQLPNGKIIDDFFVWNEPNVAQVVVLTKDNKVALVKQYKHGSRDILIECPAGYLEKGETFEEAAKREILEETGYSSKDDLIELGEIVHNPTKSSGRVKLFLMTNSIRGDSQNPDEDEEIELVIKPIESVIKMIDSGQIYTSGTISAIFLALSKLKYTKL